MSLQWNSRMKRSLFWWWGSKEVEEGAVSVKLRVKQAGASPKPWVYKNAAATIQAVAVDVATAMATLAGAGSTTGAPEGPVAVHASQ